MSFFPTFWFCEEWSQSKQCSSLCNNLSPQLPVVMIEHKHKKSLTADTAVSVEKGVYSGAKNIIQSQHKRAATYAPLDTSDEILGQRPLIDTEEPQAFWNYHHESPVSQKEEVSVAHNADSDHSPSTWSFGLDELSTPVIPEAENNNNTSPLPHQDDVVDILTDIPTPALDRTSSISVADLIEELPFVMKHSSSDLELYQLSKEFDKNEGGKEVYPVRRRISSFTGQMALSGFVTTPEEGDDVLSPRMNTILSANNSLDSNGNSPVAGYNFLYLPPSEPDGLDGDEAVQTQIDGMQAQPKEQWKFQPMGYFQLESLKRFSTEAVRRTTRGQRFRTASLAVSPFYPGRRKKRASLRVGDSVILAPFGAATVVSLPYNDSATCELLIHDWVLRNRKPAKAFVPIDALRIGEMKHFLSPIIYPGKRLGESLFGLFSSSSKKPDQRRKGLRVITSFGSGVVLQCHDALSDGPPSNSSSTIVSVRLLDWALRKRGSYAVAHLRASEVWLEGGTPETKPFMRMYKPQFSAPSPWSFNSLIPSFKWRHDQGSAPASDAVGLPSYTMCIPVGTLIKTPFFGLGIIKVYRKIDAIYTVSLLNVRQSDNHSCCLSYVDSDGLGDILCAPDDCIITPYGLGKVLRTREEDAVVEVLVGIMHCFLQPQMIDGTAPTPLGHTIGTSLGRGVVLSFSNRSRVYCIDLGWGIMYVPDATAWDEFSSVKTKGGPGILSSMWAFVRGIRRG